MTNSGSSTSPLIGLPSSSIWASATACDTTEKSGNAPSSTVDSPSMVRPVASLVSETAASHSGATTSTSSPATTSPSPASSAESPSPSPAPESVSSTPEVTQPTAGCSSTGSVSTGSSSSPPGVASHASPWPSASASAWSELDTSGQLSAPLVTPSPSRSVPTDSRATASSGASLVMPTSRLASVQALASPTATSSASPVTE